MTVITDFVKLVIMLLKIVSLKYTNIKHFRLLKIY